MVSTEWTRRRYAVPSQPVLIYDGDCAFCTSCVNAVRRWLHPPVDFLAWQHIELADYGVTQAQAEVAVQWIGPDGRESGAQAFAALLRHSGGIWWLPGTLLRLPVIRQLAELVYRLIAANRHHLPGGTPACALPAATRTAATESTVTETAATESAVTESAVTEAKPAESTVTEPSVPPAPTPTTPRDRPEAGLETPDRPSTA
jgi:predicted DCC family thiol-disulfide oxidoreductase YuxK